VEHAVLQARRAASTEASLVLDLASVALAVPERASAAQWPTEVASFRDLGSVQLVWPVETSVLWG
jgi:hypothetical protein